VNVSIDKSGKYSGRMCRVWRYVEVQIECFFVEGGLNAVGGIDGYREVKKINGFLAGADFPLEVIIVKLLLEVKPCDVIFGDGGKVAPYGEDVVDVSFIKDNGVSKIGKKGEFVDGEV
jgi:hypothetical protein